MKKQIISFLMLVVCAGCQREEKKVGALSQIQEFQVRMFFSPFEKLDRELVFQATVEALRELGNVQVFEAKQDLFALKNQSPILLLSMGGHAEASIEVIGAAEVLVNRFKTACSIWKTTINGDQNLPYPEIEDGAVVFKKGSVVDKVGTVSVVTKAFLEFANEYHRDNPSGLKPTFHIYKENIL